jgi:hypothetical protein
VPATVPVAKPPGRPVLAGKAAAAKAPVKTFSIVPWAGSNEGTKTLLYSRTGRGKTSLAAMLEDAVFFGLDDGGRRIKHPKTGLDIPVVGDVQTFQELRDALNQHNLFKDRKNIVIDTVTKAETLMEQFICDTYTIKGARANSLRAFGWDGAVYLTETMRLLMADLDPHVRAGRHITLLAQEGQISVPNSEGIDFLEDGPKLSHTKQTSSRMELAEWCDHVLRIGFLNFTVATDNDKARAGKVQNATDLPRAIFTGGAAHFLAKSRPIDGKHLPPIVSFASDQDDSLWQMMFHGAIPEVAA